MVTKTALLDELFTDWECSTPGYHNKFVADGIVDESQFENASPRVLFVTKEPNNLEQTPGDFRSWWKYELKCGFTYRIAEWSYGLLNNFPPYDEIWKRPGGKAKASLSQIAFMNIKKCGGRGNSTWTCMMEHVRAGQQFIKRQIEIIDPHIIVCGLTWCDVRDAVFPGVE